MTLFKKRKSILIVEDEEDIAEGLKARLSLEKYDLTWVKDGKAGVEQARKDKPDLIIMDVMMPLINGYEACKILKEDKKTAGIPILILTALPLVKDAETAFDVGADEFLNKPYTNDRLIQKVRKLLG